MDMTAVFQGLADNAATTGLRCFAEVPDAISPPAFLVVDAEILFNQSFGGMEELNPVTCRLLVSAATDKQGQQKVKDYLKGSGPLSVKAALEADRTLGGACDDCHVMRASGPAMYEHAGQHYWGCELAVHVIGSGT
ncbi:MAG: hypothetical protein WC140_07815 [Bacteroidales bacterium]|jgi:hypothetical protein